MKKLTGFALIPLWVCVTSAYAEEDFSMDAEFSLSQDDNLNRTILSSHEVKDTFATANFGIHTANRISQIDFIRYSAHFKYEHFNNISGLDNAEAGAGLKYSIKPVSGFTKPVYIISADVAWIDSATDIRDSTVFTLGLTSSAWMTSTISARGGVAYRIKDSDSRVFDNKDLRFFINSDLLLTEQLTSYVTINYIRGDTVSTANLSSSSPEILAVINLADQIEFDTTFGANQLAYRLDSRTRTLTVGLNYAIAQKHSLDLSLRNVRSEADSNTDYAVTQISLSYLLSF